MLHVDVDVVSRRPRRDARRPDRHLDARLETVDRAPFRQFGDHGIEMQALLGNLGRNRPCRAEHGHGRHGKAGNLQEYMIRHARTSSSRGAYMLVAQRRKSLETTAYPTRGRVGTTIRWAFAAC